MSQSWEAEKPAAWTSQAPLLLLLGIRAGSPSSRQGHSCLHHICFKGNIYCIFETEEQLASFLPEAEKKMKSDPIKNDPNRTNVWHNEMKSKHWRCQNNKFFFFNAMPLVTVNMCSTEKNLYNTWHSVMTKPLREKKRIKVPWRPIIVVARIAVGGAVDRKQRPSCYTSIKKNPLITELKDRIVPRLQPRPYCFQHRTQERLLESITGTEFLR